MKPILQSLVLAEKIYMTDDRRYIIVGTFNTLLLSKSLSESTEVEFPTGSGSTKKQVIHPQCSPGTPYLFASLTEVRGSCKCIFRFVDLSDNKVLFEGAVELQGTDPLQTFELSIPLPQLPVTIAGVYAIEFLHDDSPLGSLRVMAHVVGPKSESE